MFLNEVNFQAKIEEMVSSGNATYIDAILEFCDTNDIEYESLKKIISSNLKDKIRLDAEDSGLMKQLSRLPL